MQYASKKRGGLGFAASLSLVAISVALGMPHANAQDAGAVSAKQKPARTAAVTPKGRAIYYVDFRARTAASYGHAFVWYGRTDKREVEVAGLHPATDNVLPYILGHVIPVVSETGASYGDLDEQYLTASYRVFMEEPEAARTFAYIKRLQATSPFWNATTYNCVSFIQDIARHMGLRVPNNHLLYPEDWVKSLRALNGRGRIGRLPSSGRPASEVSVSAPPARAPATASAPRPASPPATSYAAIY